MAYIYASVFSEWDIRTLMWTCVVWRILSWRLWDGVVGIVVKALISDVLCPGTDGITVNVLGPLHTIRIIDFIIFIIITTVAIISISALLFPRRGYVWNSIQILVRYAPHADSSNVVVLFRTLAAAALLISHALLTCFERIRYASFPAHHSSLKWLR